MKRHWQADEPGVGVAAQVGQAAAADLGEPERLHKRARRLKRQHGQQSQRNGVHAVTQRQLRRLVGVREAREGAVHEAAGDVGENEAEAAAEQQHDQGGEELEPVRQQISIKLRRFAQRAPADLYAR
jgi:hypothetical protein